METGQNGGFIAEAIIRKLLTSEEITTLNGYGRNSRGKNTIHADTILRNIKIAIDQGMIGCASSRKGRGGNVASTNRRAKQNKSKAAKPTKAAKPVKALKTKPVR